MKNDRPKQVKEIENDFYQRTGVKKATLIEDVAYVLFMPKGNVSIPKDYTWAGIRKMMSACFCVDVEVWLYDELSRMVTPKDVTPKDIQDYHGHFFTRRKVGNRYKLTWSSRNSDCNNCSLNGLFTACDEQAQYYLDRIDTVLQEVLKLLCEVRTGKHYTLEMLYGMKPNKIDLTYIVSFPKQEVLSKLGSPLESGCFLYTEQSQHDYRAVPVNYKYNYMRSTYGMFLYKGASILSAAYAKMFLEHYRELKKAYSPDGTVDSIYRFMRYTETMHSLFDFNSNHFIPTSCVSRYAEEFAEWSELISFFGIKRSLIDKHMDEINHGAAVGCRYTVQDIEKYKDKMKNVADSSVLRTRLTIEGTFKDEAAKMFYLETFSEEVCKYIDSDGDSLIVRLPEEFIEKHACDMENGILNAFMHESYPNEKTYKISRYLLFTSKIKNECVFRHYMWLKKMASDNTDVQAFDVWIDDRFKQFIEITA